MVVKVRLGLYLELEVDVWLEILLRYIISGIYHLSVSDLKSFLIFRIDFIFFM